MRYVRSPSGTHKDLDDYRTEFADLSLEDFIIPSVRGWQEHGKKNGYPTVSADGKLVNEPQAAGAVNLPVYHCLADVKNPGRGCPNISEGDIYNSYGLDKCNPY